MRFTKNNIDRIYRMICSDLIADELMLDDKYIYAKRGLYTTKHDKLYNIELRLFGSNGIYIDIPRKLSSMMEKSNIRFRQAHSFDEFAFYLKIDPDDVKRLVVKKMLLFLKRYDIFTEDFAIINSVSCPEEYIIKHELNN